MLFKKLHKHTFFLMLFIAIVCLGLVKDFNYSSSECQIHKNDIALFYTDGIYEVDTNEMKLYGRPGLLSTVKNHMNTPFEQLLDEILDEIKGIAGSEQFRDDVCIVGMHVKKVSSQFVCH